VRGLIRQRSANSNWVRCRTGMSPLLLYKFKTCREDERIEKIPLRER
jgi:hypothetical protein